VDHAAVSLLVLVVAVAAFIWNRLPVGAVAILTSATLWLTGVLSVNNALAGFGDPVGIFIAALFVVSEGIDSAGVTTWAGQAGAPSGPGTVAVKIGEVVPGTSMRSI